MQNAEMAYYDFPSHSARDPPIAAASYTQHKLPELPAAQLMNAASSERTSTYRNNRSSPALGSLRSTSSRLEGTTNTQLTISQEQCATARPGSATSRDSAREIALSFLDFDGVHYVHPDEAMGRQKEDSEVSQPESIISGLLPGPSVKVPDHQDMIYYPAPVPSVIKLPKRLSKRPPATVRQNRHSEVLDSLPQPVGNRPERISHLAGPDQHSYAGCGLDDPTQQQRAEAGTPRNSYARLPPQLRASAFFEHPAFHQDVLVKEESAVATLESILDASADAPVSAFTEHPFVGHAGSGVYERQFDQHVQPPNISQERALRGSFHSARPDSTFLADRGTERPRDANHGSASLGTRQLPLPRSEYSPSVESAHASEIHDVTDSNLPTISRNPTCPFPVEGPTHKDGSQVDLENEVVEEDQFTHSSHYGQPTTLLAELQLRKQYQRQRNMTAATAFPNGMRSTLLEIDAVAEVQKKSRKQKRVALAWEEDNGPDEKAENRNDEEIPLARLLPSTKTRPLSSNLDMRSTKRLEMPADEAPPAHIKNPRRDACQDDKRRTAGSVYRVEYPDLHTGSDYYPYEKGEATFYQSMERLGVGDQARQGRNLRSRGTNFANDLIARFGGEFSADEGEQGHRLKRTVHASPLRGVPPQAQDSVAETSRKSRLMMEPVATDSRVSQARPPPVGRPYTTGWGAPSASHMPGVADFGYTHRLGPPAPNHVWPHSTKDGLPPWHDALNRFKASTRASMVGSFNAEPSGCNHPPSVRQRANFVGAEPRSSHGPRFASVVMNNPYAAGAPSWLGTSLPPPHSSMEPLRRESIHQWRLDVQP